MRLRSILMWLILVSLFWTACSNGDEGDAPAPVTSAVAAWRWAFAAGGIGSDFCRGAALDASGRAVVTGDFANAATIAGTQLSASGRAGYVVQFDSTGRVLWSRTFPGAGVDIDVDAATGDAFVTGTINASFTFAPGFPANITFGSRESIVARYSATGTPLWAVVTGSSGADSGNEIVVGNGVVAATGPFTGSTYNFPDGTTRTLEGGEADVWLGVWSTSGQFQWGTSLRGTGYEEGRAVSLDANGNVLLAGEFDGSLILPGSTLSSAGSSDIYVIKYGTGGTVQWARRFGSTGADAARGVDPAPDGGVIVSGEYSGTVAFGGITLTSRGGRDIFVLKLDGNGNPVWARSIGSTGNENGCEIEVTNDGGIYTAGNHFDGCLFPGGTTLTSAGQQDQFLAKWTATGELQWAVRGGSPAEDINFALGHDKGRTLVVGTTLGASQYGNLTALPVYGQEDGYGAWYRE